MTRGLARLADIAYRRRGRMVLAVAVVAIYIGLTLLDYVQFPGLPSHMSLQTGLFLLMVTPLYFQPVRALAAAAAAGGVTDAPPGHRPAFRRGDGSGRPRGRRSR